MQKKRNFMTIKDIPDFTSEIDNSDPNTIQNSVIFQNVGLHSPD